MIMSTNPEAIVLPDLLVPEEDPSWRKQAKCNTAGFDFFDYKNVEEAKSLCATCPVTIRCLKFARDNKITDGVWGGVYLSRRR